MGGRETRAYLARHLQRLVRRKPPDPTEQRGQVLAVDVFHGEEVKPLRLADVAHAADVRVRDLASIFTSWRKRCSRSVSFAASGRNLRATG